VSTPHETVPGADAPQTPAPLRRPGSARQMFAMTVLVSEIFVVLFATLVAHGLEVADRGLVWAVGGAAMVACAVAAGLLRRGRAGYVLGTVVQVLLVLSGLAVPTMFIIGGIFAVLWIVSMRVGGRVDVERQERYRAELAHRAAADGGPADRPVDGTSSADR
jgi:hypothetical protein